MEKSSQLINFYRQFNQLNQIIYIFTFIHSFHKYFLNTPFSALFTFLSSLITYFSTPCQFSEAFWAKLLYFIKIFCKILAVFGPHNLKWGAKKKNDSPSAQIIYVIFFKSVKKWTVQKRGEGLQHQSSPPSAPVPLCF